MTTPPSQPRPEPHAEQSLTAISRMARSDFELWWALGKGVWALLEQTGEVETDTHEVKIGGETKSITVNHPVIGETLRAPTLAELVELRGGQSLTGAASAEPAPIEASPHHDVDDQAAELHRLVFVGPDGARGEAVVDLRQPIPWHSQTLDLLPLLAPALHQALGHPPVPRSQLLARYRDEHYQAWQLLDMAFGRVAGHYGPPRPDEERRRRALDQLGQRLGRWTDRQEQIEVMVCAPAAELLAGAQRELPRGCVLAICRSEGNIATGETGWQLLLRSRRGARELACDYTVIEMLANALDELRRLRPAS